MEHEPLVQGNYYHIFNRGNNRCNLFEQPDEYEHFLWLYDKYISPVADTLAWALMRNHFHFLVYIKKDMVYKYSLETLGKLAQGNKIWYENHKWETVSFGLDADRSGDAVRSEENNDLKTPIPYRHFAHLFNAYSRHLQKRTGRTGNLFERPFKRKMVDAEDYLKRVVLYIHNNPLHHGFCSHPSEYPWTSYKTSFSEKPTKLKRDEVIQLFNGKEDFEQQHNKEIDVAEIETWLEITPSELHDFDENVNAVKSKDVDRFEKRSADDFDFDLSAREAPDNVKILEDNVKMEDNNDNK